MRDKWFQQVLTLNTYICVRFSCTLFFNLACFWYPKRCTRVHHLVLKNDPNYVNFFYVDDIHLEIQVAPRACITLEVELFSPHVVISLLRLCFVDLLVRRSWTQKTEMHMRQSDKKKKKKACVRVWIQLN